MTEHFKLCTLGEGRVGKTSLVKHYLYDQFDAAQASTVKASMYSKKKLNIEGQTVQLAIWDTAGQERFHALGPIYYRDANGALLVYDLTDRDTFDRVKHWIKELKAVVGEDIELVVAGNKYDMEKNRQVNEEDALSYCKQVGAVHFYTSAKSGHNVKPVFQNLAERMFESRKKRGGGKKKPTPKGPNAGLVADDDDDDQFQDRRKTLAPQKAPQPQKKKSGGC